MFERMTERGRKAVMEAQQEAVALCHKEIGTEHLLLALCASEGTASRVLTDRLDLNLDDLRAKVIIACSIGGERPSGHIPFTPRAKKVLELALREALQLGHSYIGTEHILLALIREGEGIGCRVLLASGIDLPQVRQAVIAELNGRPVGPVPPTQETVDFEGAMREVIRRIATSTEANPGERVIAIINDDPELVAVALLGFISAYLAP